MDIETALHRQILPQEQHMDLESFFRGYIKAPPAGLGMLSFDSIAINEEGRVEITLSTGDRFVAVEDKLIPWPVKPLAQRVAAEGFDAHKGMGSR